LQRWGMDNDRLCVVGLVGVASLAQVVVVVLEQEQPPVSERKNALDSPEGKREGIAEPDITLPSSVALGGSAGCCTRAAAGIGCTAAANISPMIVAASRLKGAPFLPS
jgi:hypothetical protein